MGARGWAQWPAPMGPPDQNNESNPHTKQPYGFGGDLQHLCVGSFFMLDIQTQEATGFNPNTVVTGI